LKMKKLALISLAAALLSTGATAQQYNGFPPDPPSTGSTFFIPDFGPDRRPAAVMQRVRETCRSEGNVAEYNCRQAKRRLDGAFAEYRVRAANGTLRSQRR
jgi:hypothetical protein